MKFRPPTALGPFAAALVIVLAPPRSAPAQEGTPKHSALHPEDAASIETSDADIGSAIASLPADAHGLGEVPELRALLKRERLAVDPKNLAGDWKVRSIQVNGLGVFSYPYFKCRFREIGGMLYFEKTTGSQRRSGLLFPDGDHLVFIGGKTVNDDPQRPYSAFGGGRESDSFGKLVKIGPGEYLILLDTSETRFEIYQLKKS